MGKTGGPRALRRALLASSAVCLIALLSPDVGTRAATPSGFQDITVLEGLDYPTAVRFASDGRVFVAEKRGVIKVFDSLSDPAPEVFADLRTNVFSGWDRGLLDVALDPQFPVRPYVYALYSHDAAIGGAAPVWGNPGTDTDPCPTPPGPTDEGCVISGRLSRLTASGDQALGSEEVLVEDWCQQYPTHSVGSLRFGPDGALYASAGDGAGWTFTDWGQRGSPVNPCGDPPGGPGTLLSPPSAEGGALRSQDLRTSNDPTTLDGSIIRVDPDTGAALPGNPLYSSSDPNARRIVATGLRNPFRFAFRPGTNEIWVGDVGWKRREEINRLTNPTDAAVDNFGWPCFEGGARQSGYDAADLRICETLYASPAQARKPYYSYGHSAKVVSGESCPTGSSSISGVAFYGGGLYPPAYDGALFFADYSRGCIWVMFKGTNGLPSPATRTTLVSQAAAPVALEIGPGGDLFYVDIVGGTVHRIDYSGTNTPPVAVADAVPTSGPVPLEVTFDASRSSDPDAAGELSYAWDLDGDGAFEDSSAVNPVYTYADVGSYTVRLRVTDSSGAQDTDTVTISAGNTPPVAAITAPLPGTTWRVGDVIEFSGEAEDAEEGSLPAEALVWSLTLNHCSGGSCHEHPLQTFAGTSTGSFTAPDHDFPSHLVLRLTATDSTGLSHTNSVRLDPQTVRLKFASTPTGLRLAVGARAQVTPFRRRVIVASDTSISAPSPQRLAGARYAFRSWSDGGAQSHVMEAPPSAKTYTAKYARSAS